MSLTKKTESYMNGKKLFDDILNAIKEEGKEGILFLSRDGHKAICSQVESPLLTYWTPSQLQSVDDVKVKIISDEMVGAGFIWYLSRGVCKECGR